MSDENLFWQRILKAVIIRLYDSNDSSTALKLVDCELDLHEWQDDYRNECRDIYLSACKEDLDFLRDNQQYLVDLFKAVAEGHSWFDRLYIRLKLPEVEDEWRDNLRAMIRGDLVTNQGVLGSIARYEHKGLYYRSRTEIKIAEALDRVDAVYFPLPVAVYQGRRREPDFLIKGPTGKWGILEVQGEPYHPPSTAAQDHDRSRGFMKRGIHVVFYDAHRCFEDPDGVVREFLEIISRR